MLEEIYLSSTTIKSFRQGPLGKYPDELSEYYIYNRYAKSYLKTRFGALSSLNTWLIKNNYTLLDLDHSRLDEFIKLRRKSNKCFVRSGACSLIKRLLDLLIRDGFLERKNKKQGVGSIEVDDLLSGYRLYLNKEKGLALSSIESYHKTASNFLVYRKSNTIQDLKRITENYLHTYIIFCGTKYSSKYVQTIAVSLRCFFKYLFVNSILKKDLSTSIPKLRGYRVSHLPEYLDSQQLDQLFNSCNRDTEKGSRNYAILLLLGRVGLRASEIIKLSKQDINWQDGEFLIKGKGGKQCVMPLPNDVGEALAGYLIKFRSTTSEKCFFTSVKAPFKCLSNPSTISCIIQRLLESLRIETTAKGAHLLRYTAAKNCLRNGGSLYEVSELLRHSSIDTSAIYAKIDYKNLELLAMEWPITMEVSYEKLY